MVQSESCEGSYVGWLRQKMWTVLCINLVRCLGKMKKQALVPYRVRVWTMFRIFPLKSQRSDSSAEKVTWAAQRGTFWTLRPIWADFGPTRGQLPDQNLLPLFGLAKVQFIPSAFALLRGSVRFHLPMCGPKCITTWTDALAFLCEHVCVCGNLM